MTPFFQAGISEHAVMFPVDSIKVTTNLFYVSKPPSKVLWFGMVDPNASLRNLSRGGI